MSKNAKNGMNSFSALPSERNRLPYILRYYFVRVLYPNEYNQQRLHHRLLYVVTLQFSEGS